MYACMFYVCMYVSLLGMQFMRWAGYPVRADCGPFVVHLAYFSGMDNEDRSRHLATLDNMDVSSSHQWSGSWSNDDPWDGSHYAVHLSLRRRSRELTRLLNFFKLGFQLLPLCHIPFFQRCCGAKKKGMWYGGQCLKCMTYCSWVPMREAFSAYLYL